MSRLKDQVVLITGASSGIGLAATHAFAREGAKLMLAARRAERLNSACEAARAAGAQAHYQETDVSREADIAQLTDATMSRYGRIDILVNNAGYGHFLPLAQTTSEDLRRLMDVNFFGTFFMTRAVLPIMVKQRSGHIINISSVAGKRVFRNIGGAYNASKFAMQGLTEALRMELRSTPIHVSAVCPVATVTEFFDLAERQTGKPAKLLGPLQTAEQVANAIIAVAHHPKPEVILIEPLRILFALSALAPGFVDWLVTRFIK
ncbi:MAG: SDR family oxidoreductase [Acidobacteriota bacterium]